MRSMGLRLVMSNHSRTSGVVVAMSITTPFSLPAPPVKTTSQEMSRLDRIHV